MDLNDISKFLSIVGLPGGILIYLIWRMDKFLTFLCGKLEIYNKELGQISTGVESIVTELKDLKDTLILAGKK